MNKTIHQVGEMVGIPSRETDQILVQVRDNTAKLEGCSGPHDFSIALDRHTKQPIPIPNPTPAQTLGCKWQCSKCGGYVDAIDKSWHNRGLASAMKETGKLIDELAEANRKLGKFIRLIEFAQSADDAQTEREIGASATFRESLAYTNSEVLEYEVEELRTANTKLKSENESLRNEGLEHEKVRDLLIECRTEISRIPKLEKCVALLSSMVVCGERHSDTSQKVVNEAMS